MPIAVAAILMILGPLLMVSLAVIVPVLAGLVACELGWRKIESVSSEVAEAEPLWRRVTEVAERIQLERGVARGFVVFGGVFWTLAVMAMIDWTGEAGRGGAFIAASVPMFVSLTTLVVGWYWERIAAVGLAAASLVAVGLGVFNGFVPAMWALVVVTMIGPMLTASALFWLARREHEALVVLRLAHPELALSTVRGSA